MDSTEHKEKLISSLQSILQKNFEAELGLNQVKEKTNSPTLKKWLHQKADERKEFAEDILTELKKLGSEAKPSSSFAGTAHRVWIDVKTALSTNRDETILEECITGDEASVEEYKQHLKAPYMAGTVVGVLADQRAKIEQSLETFKKLEDLVESKS